jgi:PhnB protein
MVKTIPEGYTTVTPIFVVKDARKAIDFYKKAFGATERHVLPNTNGSGILHAELKIGNAIIMLGEENSDSKSKSAEKMGGSPVSFYIYVNDVDSSFKKAVDAGATKRMEVREMFWGDRMGSVTDPFGYSWSLATHTKDLSDQEIQKGAKEFSALHAVK